MGKMNCTDGRQDNGRAKLNWRNVREIRRRGRVEVGADLAAEFGVSQSTISLILLRKTWQEREF